MNYQSLIKRINKAIDNASAKTGLSKVHVVDIDCDMTNLSGLVVVLASTSPKQMVQNTSPDSL